MKKKHQLKAQRLAAIEKAKEQMLFVEGKDHFLNNLRSKANDQVCLSGKGKQKMMVSSKG